MWYVCVCFLLKAGFVFCYLVALWHGGVTVTKAKGGGIVLSTTNLDHNTHSKVLSKVRGI